MALIAGACSSDKKADPVTTTPVTTPVTEPGVTTAPADPGATTPPTDPVDPSNIDNLAPPTGDEIVVGLVNTEGTPGLDFPDIRIDIQAAVDFLNEHGGMGNRPIKIVNCTAKGSPETSQACAQELVGKNVELVMVGLDLFVDYPTYTAANIPVIGMLPILPTDFNANALYLTGGSATVEAAQAVVARDYFKATSVGIVASSNPGAAATMGALNASLDKLGIPYKNVVGGDNETDAGYQGLMKEAAADNPTVLVSLYSDAGCIGTMKGRAALGITIPVITTGICASNDVISVVGDAAKGWIFTGSQSEKPSADLTRLKNLLAPVQSPPIDPPEDLDPNGLSLGAIGYLMIMSITNYANAINAAGDEVTGESIYNYLKTTKGLFLAGGQTAVECGKVPTYSSYCSFTFAFAEYGEGGKITTVPGLEAVDSTPGLP